MTASAPRIIVFTRLNSPACAYPYRRLAAALAGGRRTARGRRDSLDLRRRAFSSPSPGRFIPALSIGRAWAPSTGRAAFPLGDPLSSTASAAPPWALFGGFAGTTGSSDFPPPRITGLPPERSPHDPPNHHHRRVTVGSPGSRAWRLRACTGSSTPRGPTTAREHAAADLAFRFL